MRGIIIALMLLLVQINITEAATEEEMELECAIMAMATYSSDTSSYLKEYMETRGYEVREPEEEGVHILMATKGERRIMAIRGTEDGQDAKYDLKIKLVPLNNNKLPNGALVHEGFRMYAEEILKSGMGQQLRESLEEKKSCYLTGHSLGGAVAQVIAAKLIEEGQPTEGIRVITFGAPAVGNKKFATEWEERMRVTRISVSGDPIKRSLKALGYSHLGEEKKYKPAKSVEHFPHKMAVYLDCAIRRYLDEEEVATEGGVSGGSKVYITALRIQKNKVLEGEDEKYIEVGTRAVLRRMIPGAIIEEGVRIIEEEGELFRNEGAIKAAREQGCERVISHYVRIERIKEDRGGAYRITLEETEYDLEGFPRAMETASMTTREVTILEGVILTQIKSASDQ